MKWRTAKKSCQLLKTFHMLFPVLLMNIHLSQFHIPGHTKASGVKPTKVRLKRGRKEATRAVAMANHHCFAFNCIIKKQKNI